jgi:hypothetical protein
VRGSTKRWVGIVCVVGIGVALLAASESQEVVVLQTTTTASGKTHSTSLWVVDDGETT